jgi:large subunit ribosomal protein L2
MPIKTYKRTSPGRRNSSVRDFSELTRKEPEKSLSKRILRGSGRNFSGKVTSRFRGGGAMRKYRLVDFKRDKVDVPGKVAAIEYDPNRSADIALLHFVDGEKRYILSPKGLKVGEMLVSAERCEPRIGNCMPLKNIPLGLEIHNIEMAPGRGGKLAKSAGMQAILNARDGEYVTITLPSGEVRKIFGECRATIGQVGNLDYQNIRWGKAGRTRYRGRKPHNRGTSMNPIDHPMGGGEGRTGGGRNPCSPTGLLAKGGKTRNRRKTSSNFILRRRKK